MELLTEQLGASESLVHQLSEETENENKELGKLKSELALLKAAQHRVDSGARCRVSIRLCPRSDPEGVVGSGTQLGSPGWGWMHYLVWPRGTRGCQRCTLGEGVRRMGC